MRADAEKLFTDICIARAIGGDHDVEDLLTPLLDDSEKLKEIREAHAKYREVVNGRVYAPEATTQAGMELIATVECILGPFGSQGAATEARVKTNVSLNQKQNDPNHHY